MTSPRSSMGLLSFADRFAEMLRDSSFLSILYMKVVESGTWNFSRDVLLHDDEETRQHVDCISINSLISNFCHRMLPSSGNLPACLESYCMKNE